jgi:hypothetical protein
MAESALLNRKLFALLIGIDCYLPNQLPDGGSYPSLGGCVRDINHVESFLKGRLGIPDKRIIKLTSTNGDNSTPVEPENKWPTYENIVVAFQKIIGDAKAGEQVYIHFSGHGGRTQTIFPELKGQNGLDESLVPTDIGRPGTRYLRDVELAHLLKRMDDNKLFVTVVLDSCHSGGATRGLGGGATRGISSIDTTERPTESLVATREDLARTWASLPPAQTRDAQLGGGWVPEMKNTLLLAACRANELANEFAFQGEERNGALTYWLLDSLRQIGPGLTFKMLHDRILAKVHTKFPQQTPQLHGDGSRVVFDTNRVPQPAAVRVLQVDSTNRRLKLDAGKAQGIDVGAHFAVYPSQETDFTLDAKRLALLEITEAQATESWAAITESLSDAPLEEGAQAVMLEAGAIQLRGRIRLVQQKGLPSVINQSAALRQLKQEIGRSNWIRLAKKTEAADYQVAVNAKGEYEVWDPSGQLIENLRPALKIADQNASARLARRLAHLTKYRNVKLIDNSASHATLARQLIVELIYTAAIDSPGGEIVLNVGDSAVLRIENASSKILNITIFDLQPDWGIKQVYPADADSEVLDPGGSIELPMNDVSLPDGYTEGIDTVKVFATIEPTGFRWLELPALDEPLARGVSQSRAPNSPLEKLMAEFAADAPSQKLRAFNLVAPVAATWAVAQLDFRVRRPV